MAGTHVVGGVGAQHGHAPFLEPGRASNLAGAHGLGVGHRTRVQAFPVIAGAHQQNVTFFHLHPLGPFRGLQVFGHYRLVRGQPGDAPDGWDVQQYSAGDDAVGGHFDGMGLGAFPGGNLVGGNAVVELSLPGVVGKGVDVGDGLAVKHHADELGGAPAHQPPLRWVGVPPFPAVHHVTLDLKADIGRDVGDDGTGTANRHAVVDQSGCLLSLVWGNQVQASKLVILAPTAPIGKGGHPI